MSMSEELEKLGKLKADGLMSDEEFTKAKARLLDGDQASSAQIPSPPSKLPAETPVTDVNQWAMFMHLAQLANCVAPPLGFVGSIVMWQIKKDESPLIDKHGKMLTNWAISALIYWVVSTVLVIVLVGFLMMAALYIMGAIFALVGGLKARDGEYWEYPMTIKFIK